MTLTGIAKQIGRGLLTIAFITTVSMASPGTAYARHGNGAGIALGILGGMLAGAAIASAAAPPPYYAAPPAYYYPYAPQAYSAAPAYYHTPPQTYYAPAPYYGSPYYYGN